MLPYGGRIFNLFWGIVGGLMFLRARHAAIIQLEVQCYELGDATGQRLFDTELSNHV